MQHSKITIDMIDAFVFDFDGVLTNNRVYLNQDGKESVSCSRSDGLAFDLLKKINKPVYILSTEKNTVVTARANKLRVPVLQGVGDKVEKLKNLAEHEGYNLDKVCYIGNDVNDFRSMQLCGYSACPADSHKDIKRISTFILKTDGGAGVVRELLEDVFQINFLQVLYPQ